ncbi:hypothetical protein FRB90_011219 [Tulasnella sp. 427]|nr:hypothetical protein FRB90_011219 [Tulasnella sp. 427]
MRFFTTILPVIAALSTSFTAVLANPVQPANSENLTVRASRAYPDILASAQAQVAKLTPQIEKLVPLGTDAPQIDVGAVGRVLDQVNSVVLNATSQVKSLIGQPDDQIRGGVDDNTLYYVTQDFVITIARTIAPAGSVGNQYPEIQSRLDTINQSVDNFNNTVGECFIWLPILGGVLIFVGAILTKWGESLLNKP